MISDTRAVPARSLLFVFAAAMAAVVLRAILQVRGTDLGFDDEAGYLASGLLFLRNPFPAGENSPLYSLWYWLLSQSGASAVHLYFGNWIVLFGATVFAFGASLRRSGLGLVSVALFVALASWTKFFDTWPYVTMLSTLLVVLAAWLGLANKESHKAFALMSAVLLIATFVRPELLLASGLLMLIAVKQAVAARRFVWLSIPVLVLIFLVAVFGPPFASGRSMYAFGQHYAVNVVQAQHLSIDPWNHWQEIVVKDFGAAASPLEALRTNPRAFFWHVGCNLREIPRSLSLLTLIIPGAGMGLRIVSGLAIAVLLSFGIYRALRKVRSESNSRRALALAGCLLVPYAVSALLISPRLHYFLAPLAALTIAAACGFAGWRPKVGARAQAILVLPALLGVLGLVVTPPARPNLLTVDAMKQLSTPQEGVVIEPDFGRPLFAEWRLQSRSADTCKPFASCLAEVRPVVIVSNARLIESYAGDADFSDFLQEPGKRGYSAVSVSSTDSVIFIRRDTHP